MHNNSGLNDRPIINCEQGPTLATESYDLPQNINLKIEGVECITNKGELVVDHRSATTVTANAGISQRLRGFAVKNDGTYSVTKGKNNERAYNGFR